MNTPASKPTSEILDLMNYFYSAYEKYRNMPYYGRNLKKEKQVFEGFMKDGLSADEIKLRINRLFESDDEFIQGSNYSPLLFRSVINKLIQKPRVCRL